MGQRTLRRRNEAWAESERMMATRAAARRAALAPILRFPAGTFVPMPIPHEEWMQRSADTIAVSEQIRRLSQSRRARRMAFDEFAP